MSIISRLFGTKSNDWGSVQKLVANPEVREPLSLQVLFSDGPSLDSTAFTLRLQSHDPVMRGAQAEIDPDLNKGGSVLGLAGWGKHVIRIVGFNLKMPTEAVEACVAPSHYGPDLKERARAHSGHVLLYYVGYESSRFEQYVALAAVAWALAHLGAIVVLNEAGHTSFPAAALAAADSDGGILEQLRSIPLLCLYCGFVKYEVEGIDGVWMRTYGAHLLGLPDLAGLAAGHHEGERYFNMFDNILGYIREAGANIAPGHTSQIGDEEFVRFRSPKEEEYFLASEGELLVVDLIAPSEVNRKVQRTSA